MKNCWVLALSFIADITIWAIFSPLILPKKGIWVIIIRFDTFIGIIVSIYGDIWIMIKTIIFVAAGSHLGIWALTPYRNTSELRMTKMIIVTVID